MVEIQEQMTWQCLKAGELKRETEILIFTAEEQALRTNAIKNDIDHQDVSPLCRLSKEKVDSVSKIFSSCSVLAVYQYSKRHDKLGKKVYWLLCKKFETEHEGKWFSHQAEPVLENDKFKLLWDFAI